MTTGLHTVADIYCNKCLQIVGWKYVSPAPDTITLPSCYLLCHPSFLFSSLRFVLYGCLCCALPSVFLVLLLTFPLISRFHSQEEAFEKSQKYKEGKFILERCVPARVYFW